MSSSYVLSDRAAVATRLTPSYFGPLFAQALADPWSQHNLGGYIILCVAENRLSASRIRDRLASNFSNIPDGSMGYDASHGTATVRAAIAHYLQRTVVQGSTINAEDLYVYSGVAAILDLLAFALCNPGDGILIPAPYYPMFDFDLQVRNGTTTVPVHVDWEGNIERQLDRAARRSKQQGHPVSMLLITSPDNPTGRVYTRQVLTDCLRWCFNNKVHLVSDEIYAKSIFKPAHFTSMIDILHQCHSTPPTSASTSNAIPTRPASRAPADLPPPPSSVPHPEGPSATIPLPQASTPPPLASPTSPNALREASKSPGTSAKPPLWEPKNTSAVAVHDRPQGASRSQGITNRDVGHVVHVTPVDHWVHVVGGMSKDWCASGLRVGWLYSKSPGLKSILPGMSMSIVPFPLQYTLAHVLADDAWVDQFLDEATRNVEAAYDMLAGALSGAGIPFQAAVAGLFVWVDLRGMLSEPSWEAEWKLIEDIFNEAKLMVTPGHACHAAEPGYVRICYAGVPPEALQVAASRLVGFVEQHRALANDASVQQV